MVTMKELKGMLKNDGKGRMVLNQAGIKKGDFRDAVFKGIDFKDVRFLDSDFSGALFEGCTFEDCEFVGCHARTADFDSCGFKHVPMEGVNLDSAAFEKCSFDGLVVSGTGVNLHFEDCAMDLSALRGDFAHMYMRRCVLGDVSLKGDFAYSVVYDTAGFADFGDAKMDYMTISASDLVASDGRSLCGYGCSSAVLEDSRFGLGSGDSVELAPNAYGESLVCPYGASGPEASGSKKLRAVLNQADADRREAFAQVETGSFEGNSGIKPGKDLVGIRAFLEYAKNERYAGTRWGSASLESDLKRFEDQREEAEAFRDKGPKEERIYTDTLRRMAGGVSAYSPMYQDAAYAVLRDGYTDMAFAALNGEDPESGIGDPAENVSCAEIKESYEVDRLMAAAEALEGQGGPDDGFGFG